MERAALRDWTFFQFERWVEVGNKHFAHYTSAIETIHDSATAQPTCNGSAERQQSGAIRLTSDKVGQTGSAFLPLPAELQTFIVDFAFRIDHPGADGMAFVMHSDASLGLQALGEGGCQLGYGGIPSSLALEIDTYVSQDRCDDPNYVPHLSLQSRGKEGNDAHHRSSLWWSKRGDLPSIDDGRRYSLRIEVDDLKILRAFFTDEDGAYVSVTPSGGVLLPELRDGPYFVGWTAACGGISQSHQVLSYQVHRAERR